MLSKEDLARIVKDEAENHVKKGKRFVGIYYILLDGKMYPRLDYDKEVAEGKRSSNDIYAYVDIYGAINFDSFLLYANYIFSVEHIVDAYLRKSGFTIVSTDVVEHPTPNLKYYISAGIKRDKDRKPEYLVVNIYDVDTLAESLRIPQIVEQRVGSKPREIARGDAFDIERTVDGKQPLLAGHTYEEAWDILADYYINREVKYKDEAYKIVLAYSQLFPVPYRVCYEWKAGRFVKIDCLKIELLTLSS